MWRNLRIQTRFSRRPLCAYVYIAVDLLTNLSLSEASAFCFIYSFVDSWFFICYCLRCFDFMEVFPTIIAVHDFCLCYSSSFFFSLSLSHKDMYTNLWSTQYTIYFWWHTSKAIWTCFSFFWFNFVNDHNSFQGLRNHALVSKHGWSVSLVGDYSH